MRRDTDHESFVLKPSTVHGVGVFILHDVAQGAHLELFRKNFPEEVREVRDIPEEFQAYCIVLEDEKMLCPKFFNQMDIGNYISHSKNPNMRYDKGYFAKWDSKAGEELFADYRELSGTELVESYH